MHLTLRHKALSILTVGLSLAASGCGDESNDPGNTTPEQLLTAGLETIPQMGEALSRLVLTLQGIPQPGVNLTPITGGVQGTLGVDLDGNGSNEITVSGSLVYIDSTVGISGGATLTITGISGGDVDGNLTASVIPFSPTDVIIGPGTGSFDSPAGTIAVTSLGLSIGFGTPTPIVTGSSTFTLDSKAGDIVFVDNSGELEISLQYDGEVTTVP